MADWEPIDYPGVVSSVMAVRRSRPDRVLLQALRLPAVIGIEVGLAGAVPPPAPYHWLPARIRQSAESRRGGLAASFCASRALARAGYAGQQRVKAEADRPALWPAGWTGSLGWTDSGAVAIAAPCGSQPWLGVDLSLKLSPLQRRWLQPLLTTAAEMEVLSAHSIDGLSLLYSAKEALLRALQPLLGRSLDYQALHCIALDGAQLSFEPAAELAAQWPAAGVIQTHYLINDSLILNVTGQFEAGA